MPLSKITPDSLGGVPAFEAYTSTAQSISAGTWTKVQFNTEQFDTNNNYDNATNYRFTPTVAGYYQINATVNGNGSNTSWCRIAIYKNGTLYRNAPFVGASTAYSMEISDIIQCNGSTDYVEIYVYLVNADTINSSFTSFFSGVLVRSA